MVVPLSPLGAQGTGSSCRPGRSGSIVFEHSQVTPSLLPHVLMNVDLSVVHCPRHACLL